MCKKSRPRLSTEPTTSQEKREYVLEDVFWVPISNCSPRSTTHFASALVSEKLENNEEPRSDDFPNRGET
jgi:hypothetical protein